MKENREQHEINTRNILIKEFNLDMKKEYSAEEIKKLLKLHKKDKGVLKFEPSTSYLGYDIIEILVYIEMRVSDGIHNVLGSYENKSRCESCEELFDEHELFEVYDNEGKCLYCCDNCRHKSKLRIGYSNFRNMTKHERELFILEESKFGINYDDYVLKINTIVKCR